MKINFKRHIYLYSKYNMEYPINNPYFTYPGAPFRGYHNFDLYNRELIRLSHFLKTELASAISNNCFFHFCIGAAMEELSESMDFQLYKQWRQLLPIHIDEFASKYQFPIRIIIISPNSSFENDTFLQPKFIECTNDFYDWKKTDDKSYVSNKFNIIINIFCTMMPHIDERNKKIMDYLNQNKLIEEFNWIKKLEQNNIDIVFIKEFYNQLSILFKKIIGKNGIITCYSFAVFNELTKYNSLNDYKMFEEITKLFLDNENNSKKLLGRWIYDKTCQYVIPFNYEKILNISYVDIKDLKENVNETKFVNFDIKDGKIFIII